MGTIKEAKQGKALAVNTADMTLGDLYELYELYEQRDFTSEALIDVLATAYYCGFYRANKKQTQS